MKNICILFILLLFSLCPCGAQEFTPTRVVLGGHNEGESLYQKKHPVGAGFEIEYDTWDGYEVSSNAELEEIYKLDPECEAIKFRLWSFDTSVHIELSEQIGAFNNLKYLEIYSCNITRYPKSIERLEKLEELVLVVCKLPILELDFSRFQSLKHLTIDFANQLEEFPTSIFECANLVTLKLSQFHFLDRYVINGVEYLENLVELRIGDSKLFLPEATYHWPHLETLVLDRHDDRLPVGLFPIASLRRLVITGADTLDLEYISTNQNLEYLFLFNNRYLQGTLNNPKLDHLILADFRHEQTILNFDNLPSLARLSVTQSRNIKKLGPISNPELRSIVVNYNRDLHTLEFVDEKLQNLENVTIKKKY